MGFYFRVIEPGPVAADDPVTLLRRPYQDLTVERTMLALFSDAPDRDLLDALKNGPDLSRGWRDLLTKRLAGAPPADMLTN